LIDERLDINLHLELKDNFGKPLIEDFVEFRLSVRELLMISELNLSKLISSVCAPLQG
jgi:hypothetical protein